MTDGLPTSSPTTSKTDASSSGAGTSMADVAAAYRSSGADVTSDIGQSEAYIVNLKRLVADELDHDQFVRANRERLIRNGEDSDQSHRDQATRAIEESLRLQSKLNDSYLTHIANLNAETVAERERTVRVGDVASNNMWTSDAAFDAIVEVTVAKVLTKLGVKPSA